MVVRVLLAPREGCSLEADRGDGGGGAGGGEARAILVQVHCAVANSRDTDSFTYDFNIRRTADNSAAGLTGRLLTELLAGRPLATH